MKILNIVPILIILVLQNNIFSQNEIKITEKGSVEICGHYVIVDGIWISDGIIKASISVLENQNSKPIIGGFKKGDEIKISSGDDCNYYIFSVNKAGLNASKGYVVISKTPQYEPVQACGDYITFYESQKIQLDTLDWYLMSVVPGENEKSSAKIDLYYNSNLTSSLSLKENDYLWTGECLYMVDTVQMASKDNIPDPDGNYEINPARVFFKKVNEYFYPSADSIKGEQINKPNETGTEYIIRKALLYTGKKPTKKELKNTKPKIWLLKIFYEARGGATRLIQIEREGKSIMVEFQPVRTFENEAEALEYAKEKGITDIDFQEK